MSTKHPIQPLEKDKHGTLRFKENKIVNWMLEQGRNGNKFDLNTIAIQNFSLDDMRQFNQLIGYSLTGYGELSFVDDETYETAEKMHNEGKTEKDARIEYLEETLDAVRKGLKEIVPCVFRIHPDDLEE